MLPPGNFPRANSNMCSKGAYPAFWCTCSSLGVAAGAEGQAADEGSSQNGEA